METKNSYLQLVQAYKSIFIALVLLICCISTLALMSVNTKSNLPIFQKVDTVELRTDPKVTLGKTLFLNNCAQCHAKDMKTQMTGPALSGVQSRWQDEAALFDWIVKGRVSEEKADYMRILKKQFDDLKMPPFAHFTEGDVKAILAYIASVK